MSSFWLVYRTPRPVAAASAIEFSSVMLPGRSAPSPPERETTSSAVSENSFAPSNSFARSISLILASGLVQSWIYIPTSGRSASSFT